MAESPLTGNIGFTNNYIWRGITQSSDTSAISGGIDFAHDSGFYAGTWLSSMSEGQNGEYEQDWYLGYSFDAGPVGLDVGYLLYTYPIDNTLPDPKLDFAEVYVNASFQNFGAGIAYTVDKEDSTITEDNDLYAYVSAEFEIKEGLTLGLLYGDYDLDGGSTDDYSHIQISLSKGDFTFALEDNDVKTTSSLFAQGIDDPRFTVSYSKSFDL